MQNVSSINEDLVYIYPDANFAKGMNPKILKQVDLKLDDGEHWNGRMRTACYGKGTNATTPSDTTTGYTDYDYAIKKRKKCSNLNYAL